MFREDHALRRQHLEDARANARHTDWTVCPPENSDQNTKPPKRYQTVGPRGLGNLEALITAAMFTPGMPWCAQELTPELKFDKIIDDKTKQSIADDLWLQDLAIQSTIESAHLFADDNCGSDGFLAGQLRATRQLLVAGDTLERVEPDYRVRLYPIDHYVTRRDPCMRVLYHVTWETVDILTLPPKFVRDQLGENEAELKKKSPRERTENLWTLVEWQPRKKTWVVTQEVNGRVLLEKEYKVSRYIPTSMSLTPGEHYGRAFISKLEPDLNSYDAIRKAELYCAAACADVKWAIAHGSNTREEDLYKPPLSVIRANVRGGQVDDIACVQAGKVGDFAVVHQVGESVRRDLSRAFLLEDEMVRPSERTTTFEIQRLVDQLNQATGGLYTPIADMKHKPLFYIVRDMMRQKKELPALTESLDRKISVSVLTGVAALARRNRVQGMVTVAELANRLGPETARRIDGAVMLQEAYRGVGVYAPGLIKSDAKLAQEDQQAMKNQAAMEANTQAIQSTGKVAEQVAAENLLRNP